MARLSPYVFVQELDNNGLVLNGGKLYTYAAGTTTPKATYTDSSGLSLNTNPIILDSSGRANIWLGTGAYKFVLKTSADVTIQTTDDVAGDSDNAFGSNIIIQSTNLSVTNVLKAASVYCTSPLTVTFDPAATLGDGFYISVMNASSGSVTLDPDGSETINGQLSAILAPGQSGLVLCDGTQLFLFFKSEAAFSTGDVKLTMKVVPDAGWVMCNDGTIGSATSGATTLANATALPLYTLIYNNVSDTYAPVSGGRGANAAADFAANKTIGLTKMLGRAMAISGSGSGLTTRALGQTVGEETHILTVPELPSHDHPTIDAGHFHTAHAGPNTGGAGALSDITNNAPADPYNTDTKTTGITVGNTGGDTAHNNMQPTSFLNAMIKL